MPGWAASLGDVQSLLPNYERRKAGGQCRRNRLNRDSRRKATGQPRARKPEPTEPDFEVKTEKDAGISAKRWARLSARWATWASRLCCRRRRSWVRQVDDPDGRRSAALASGQARAGATRREGGRRGSSTTLRRQGRNRHRLWRAQKLRRRWQRPRPSAPEAELKQAAGDQRARRNCRKALRAGNRGQRRWKEARQAGREGKAAQS